MAAENQIHLLMHPCCSCVMLVLPAVGADVLLDFYSFVFISIYLCGDSWLLQEPVERNSAEPPGAGEGGGWGATSAQFLSTG